MFISYPVFRIHFILMRIRIRGSASGNTDPVPVPDPDPDPDPTKQITIFFFLIYFCKRYKTHNDVLFGNFELIIHVY